MTKRTKIRACVIALLILAIVSAAAFALMNPMRKRFVVGDGSIVTLTGKEVQPNTQHDAAMWLGVYDGQLYLYPDCRHSAAKTAFNGYLCTLSDGGVQPVHRIGDGLPVRILGLSGSKLYYWAMRENDDADALRCYDLDTRQDTLLVNARASRVNAAFFTADGSLEAPMYTVESRMPMFLHVTGSEWRGAGPVDAGFALGERTYRLSGQFSDTVETLVTLDASGVEHPVDLPHATLRTLTPSEHGLALHNAGGEKLLYLITEDGEFKLLFEAECMDSTSAVAIIGSDAYLSLKRYEGYADIGLKRFKNDEIEGTWRISLTDGTKVKISSAIYDGLYPCGDVLLTTDEWCNVDVLSLDGQEVQHLLTVQ